jgi:hypothetical protein
MNSLYERLYGKTVKDYPRQRIQANGITLEDSDGDNPIAVSTHAIGRVIQPEQFAYIIDTKLNSMASDPMHEGIKVGACLRRTHRTLQRAVVGFALGILYGISQQEYTDDRNRTAIETAKKVAAQIDDDELLIGQFI